ncbi:MAG: hypothetical protein R3F49_12785 [Planctomycetota bacterium]
MKPLIRGGLAAALLVLPAAAHDGPPYPILVDEPVAGIEVSVWADPDVGEGTFYYYIDKAPGDVAIAVEATALDPSAVVTRGESQLAPAHAPYQLIGTVAFTHRGPWRARFLVTAPSGTGELVYDIDVTPPGLGPIELVWYAIPFLAAAALWLRIFLARKAIVHAPFTPLVGP